MSYKTEMTEQKFKITKDIVVIYHGECTDGFGGAWAAWKKLSGTADYFGAHYDDGPPENLVSKELYFIDFVYPRPIMEQLRKDNKKIVIIDHHKTAVDKLDLADEKLFDINHSGAVLAWQYFHADKNVPLILKHIEDRDIWRWSLDKSKETLTYFDLFDFDFDIWDDIIEKFEKDKLARQEFGKNGELLLRQWNGLTQDMIREGAVLVDFEGNKIFAINAPHIFASDLGNLLSKQNPSMAIVWQQNKFGNIGVSLRSDGSVDVAEIAKKYGGGGHKAAAAFRLKKGEPFPWKIVENKNNEI